MTSVPSGLELVAPAHYSYGVGARSNGDIWWTEFNHQKIQYINTNEQVGVPRIGVAGMFGIAVDNDGTAYVGLDLGDDGNPWDATNPSKILKRQTNGAESYIVENISRPRQLTLDASGNLYFTSEATGQVLKWTKSSGQLSLVISNLVAAEGVALASDGRIFVSEYGTFTYDGNGNVVPDQPGKVWVRNTNGTESVLATNFWRARGLVYRPTNGKLYLCTEANKADQGNSGLLVEIDPASGAATNVLEGIDYPQFPSLGADGKIYFSQTRESWVSCYNPNHDTSLTNWPTDTNILVAASGGSFGPYVSGTTLKLNIHGLNLWGQVSASGSGPVHLWIRIPRSYLDVSTNELYTDRCDSEHPVPGMFELPSVQYEAASGTCLAAALPVRGHVNNRWPMTGAGTCAEAPAAGFSEGPTAYIIYVKWTPNDRIQSIAQPAYKAGGMSILTGVGSTWIYGGGSWSTVGQTWLNGGALNSPVASSAYAEVDIGAWGGTSKYVYVLWHKNGIYRPDSANHVVQNYLNTNVTVTVNQQVHANGMDYGNDTLSGWRLLGNSKINITPSTKIRVSQNGTVYSTEYLQADAVLLSDYPLLDNTSTGSSCSYEVNPALSVSSSGPSGVGHHWGMQGNSIQYSTTSAKAWSANFDSSVFTDVSEGWYYVEVSWAYFDQDGVNGTNVFYSVNGVQLSGSVNQNRSASNQTGSFVGGNSMGSWSGFYRLPGAHYHSASNPIDLYLYYNNSLYSGKRLVADMVRLVPY